MEFATWQELIKNLSNNYKQEGCEFNQKRCEFKIFLFLYYDFLKDNILVWLYVEN
jgi:hypothetical protein